MSEQRRERDSMGEVEIPRSAYWGAHTQRAIENFPVSGLVFPPVFLQALALVKQACAIVNRDDAALDPSYAEAIIQACREAAEGAFASQFPIDIFQTGSGTSTNMNMNEVIATRSNEILTGARRTTQPVHPNDHVNMGQSSNDVIPTAIHCAVCLQTEQELFPELDAMAEAIRSQEERFADVVKTGRTHLMDAMPVTFGQELSGWRSHIVHAKDEIAYALRRIRQLAIGGTAVGTGVNTRAGFGTRVARRLSELTAIEFSETPNHFEAQSIMNAICAFSSSLRTYAMGLVKIANDLRLMNSGPFSGLGEIRLASLQPGSSIMPGKVNPVIPEAARMACMQVMGNDAVVALSCAMGEFELNVMLPVIAHNVLESITLLSGVSRLMAEKAVRTFEIDRERIALALEKNPIVATVLNPVVGYDTASAVVKKSMHEKITVRQAALALGVITEEQAARLFDIAQMTQPGFSAAGD
ncbi:MAG TPA: class II fumarate hydratase [Bacteroidota bacterium]|nr:class II fumarate hydratase [Bacteroidota bacterium]